MHHEGDFHRSTYCLLAFAELQLTACSRNAQSGIVRDFNGVTAHARTTKSRQVVTSRFRMLYSNFGNKERHTVPDLTDLPALKKKGLGFRREVASCLVRT